MVAFFVTLGQFIRAILRGLRDPEFRALFVLVMMTLLVGTLFYHRVEGWSMVDSLYFSVVTLTTVGYGDLYPTTPGARLFTTLYILAGLGILVGFVETLAKHALRGGEKERDKG